MNKTIHGLISTITSMPSLSYQNYLHRFAKSVQASRILVTGGSGFIGSNLVEVLLASKATVLSLDIREPQIAGHEESFRMVDLRDTEAVDACVADFSPEVVFHLAARTDLDGGSLEDYDSNIAGVHNLIQAVQRSSSVRRFIVTSSQLVCRPRYLPKHDQDYQPHTLYGQSKVRTEELVRAADLTCCWTIVRPTSIWGPWFGIPYRDFFDTIQRKRYVHQAGMDPLRSFGFVGNVVWQYLELSNAEEQRVNKHTFYVSDKAPIHVRGWAEKINQAFDLPPIREIPLWLLRLAAKCGDTAQYLGVKHPPLTSFRLSNLTQDNVIDMSATNEVVQDQPFCLDDGIAITVNWLRDHLPGRQT